MTAFFYTALAVTTLLSGGLAWVVYWLIALRKEDYSHARSQRQECLEERERMLEERERITRYLHGVTRVLNTNVGGISKRLSESAEIAEAILQRAPVLFKQCDGLAYWLHANDQFLSALYSVAAVVIDDDQRRRVHDMWEEGRGKVFERIYVSAELPSPLDFDSKTWIFSEDWLYLRHLMPVGSGGWKWIVRRYDNFDDPADAAGEQSTREEATDAMTAALRKLSGDDRAAWQSEAEQESSRPL